jgi:hypothetical protein
MHIKTRIITALTLAVLLVPGITLAQALSVAQLQAQIQSLTAQLRSLESQLAAAGGSTASCYTFNSNLSIRMTGNAVTELQTALQKDGESVEVTGIFDDQTASAVTAFQEKYQTAILAPYGLSYGTGYAGEKTRAELNYLFGCTASNPVTPPIVVNLITPTSTPPVNACPAWGCNEPEPILPPASITTPTSTVVIASVNSITLSGTPGTNYSQSIDITNSGNVAATWTATASPSWIWVSQGDATQSAAGSISPGWSSQFSVGVNASSLAAGATVSGTVTITGNFSTITIPVSFTDTNSATGYQTPTVTQVQGLTATVDGNALTLNWQAATASDNGTIVYNVYRTFLTSVCTINATDLISQVNGLSYTDSSLPAGTYYYCVQAQDGSVAAGSLSTQITATVSGSSTSSASPLTVQLDPANPAAAQVQTGATGVNLLAFDIFNPLSDPVRITDIMAGESLRPVSQSTTPQFNNVTLYDTTGGTAISVGTFTAFPSPQNALELTTSNIYPSSLVIPANSTKKFLITGSVVDYAYDPSLVGTTGLFYVPGSQTGIIGVDTYTNAPEQFSGVAHGNSMTIVPGQ